MTDSQEAGYAVNCVCNGIYQFHKTIYDSVD